MASEGARAALLCAISSRSTPASSRWLRCMNFSSTGKSNARFSIKPSKTSASTPRNLSRSSRSAVRTDSCRILSVANGALTSDPGLLPACARVCGWLFLIGQTLFISRIVYESTVLTCVDGPQMVGFSMAHVGHSFFLLGGEKSRRCRLSSIQSQHAQQSKWRDSVDETGVLGEQVNARI